MLCRDSSSKIQVFASTILLGCNFSRRASTASTVLVDLKNNNKVTRVHPSVTCGQYRGPHETTQVHSVELEWHSCGLCIFFFWIGEELLPLRIEPPKMTVVAMNWRTIIHITNISARLFNAIFIAIISDGNIFMVCL